MPSSPCNARSLLLLAATSCRQFVAAAEQLVDFYSSQLVNVDRGRELSVYLMSTSALVTRTLSVDVHSCRLDKASLRTQHILCYFRIGNFHWPCTQVCSRVLL
eukprot:scpid18985/ scgid28387/ 